MTHFLHGWNQGSIEAQLRRAFEPLDHLAADSYGSVEPGDVLWIVGLQDQRVRLYYRFVAEEALTQREAERRRGHLLWKGRYHFLGTGTPMLGIDITDQLRDLTFDSATRPHLIFDEDGCFSNQSFRVARRLTPASVQLLERVLQQHPAPKGDTDEFGDFDFEGHTELVARHGVLQEEGFLYFVSDALDVMRIADDGDADAETISPSKGGRRDLDYFYFIDDSGDIVRIRQHRRHGLPVEAPLVIDILEQLGELRGRKALNQLCDQRRAPRRRTIADTVAELVVAYKGDLREVIGDLSIEDLHALAADGVWAKGRLWVMPDAASVTTDLMRSRFEAACCDLDFSGGWQAVEEPT